MHLLTPPTPRRFVSTDGEGSRGIKGPNERINRWTYAPVKSTQWELKTHPSDQEEGGLGENRFDSIPSTEIKKLKAGWLGGSGDYKRGQYASSSLLSARKRLEEFKTKREEQTEERKKRRAEEITEQEARALIGLDEEEETKQENGSRLEESKRRLEAFRKLRQERTAEWKDRK
jgi:hypothetical protein